MAWPFTDRRIDHPMPVRPAGVIVCLSAIFLLSPTAAAQPHLAPDSQDEQQVQEGEAPAFRTGVDFVLIDASVTDNKGRPVPDLTRESFEIRDQGKPQEILRLDEGAASVSITIVADFSGSMRPRQRDLAQGVGVLVDLLQPGDEARLLLFNENSTLLTDSEPSQWKSALLSRVPTGQTALYDAIDRAVQEFATSAHQRRVMIVLSDGADTASRTKSAALFDSLRTSGALVYTIGLFEPGEPNTDAGILRTIAERTGGNVYFSTGTDNLSTVFSTIVQDLRSRYVLMFRAASAASTDAASNKDDIHRISVTARDAKGKRLRVRARREYSVGAN